MLKGKQTIMGLETYGKEAYTQRHVKAEQNKQRIMVFWVMVSCTLEQVYLRMSSASVCRLDHAYEDLYPKTLINVVIKQKPKTLNLATYHA